MKHWYVVMTKTGREDDVVTGLNNQYYETYCPYVYTDKRMQKRNEKECMFPGYVFVQLELGTDAIGPIKYTAGVLKMVQFGDSLPSVPDNWITNLQSREDEDYVIHIYKNFESGDPIRIKSGPFEGYEGMFIKNAKRRVFVMLNELQRRIAIKKDDIEPIVA